MALDPRLALIPGANLDTQGAVKTFQNALLSLQGEDPDTLARNRSMLANELLQGQVQGQQAQNTEAQQLNRIRSLAVFANDIERDIQTGDLASIRAKVDQRAQQLPATGVSNNDTLELKAMLDNPNIPDEQKLQEVRQLATGANQAAVRFGVIEATPGARPSQFGSSITVRDAQGNEFSQTTVRDPSTGSVRSVLTPIGAAPTQPIGNIEIVGSGGETPSERAARESRKVGEQAKATRRTKAIEAAVRKGEKAFEQVPALQDGIRMVDEAINLVQNEGASTGVIASRLPSVRESAIKLDNLQKRMGLNVIQNTTFGALSENELKFALDSALPQNLAGPDLVEWLQARKSSQSKLLNYIQDAASFLSSGENTISDFIAREQAREVNRQGASVPGAAPMPNAGIDQSGDAAFAQDIETTATPLPSGFRIISVE